MNSTRTANFGLPGIFLLLAVTINIQAQTSFARGEELFMQNKPIEALGYLEAAVSQDPDNVQAFLYLGIAYIQIDRIDDAIAVYRRILPDGGGQTARIAFNLGNAYLMKDDSNLARQFFTQAIEADPFYSSAYLNRANLLLKNGELSEALEDYQVFLALEPDSPQWDQVLRLWTLISEEFAAQERTRTMAEEAARAEEQRRRGFLQGVIQSLQTVAEDSRALSTEPEAPIEEPEEGGELPVPEDDGEEPAEGEAEISGETEEDEIALDEDELG